MLLHISLPEYLVYTSLPNRHQKLFLTALGKTLTFQIPILGHLVLL